MGELERYGFDPEVQARARRYHAERLWFKIVHYAALIALFLLFAAFGSSKLARAVSGFTGSAWLINLIYTAMFAIGFFLVDALFDWWSYRIERKYGISTQSGRSWLGDELKGGMVNLVLFLAAVPALYIGIVESHIWWLIAWGIATGFILLMGFISPVLLMPLFFKFEPLADADLVGRLRRLAERAGVKVIGVFKMGAAAKTKRAIGALTGIGATRRIILSDTLLENYTPDEIETVIAHELGHHVHKDILKGIAAFSAMFLAGFIVVDLTLAPFARIFGLGNGIETLPLLLIILGGVFAVLKPLYNTISRWFEGNADQYALELARKPEAQARVDVKLCDQNLRYAAPHPLIELLFYDHPAGIKRVKRALKFRRNSQR